jgi:RNA polymerase sigma-70 factor (ECF subfamily)
MVDTEDCIDLPTEADVLSRAWAGDAEAFCRLTEPLQASLLRQAVALAGDLATAEDLVSETLVAAWTSLARYNQSCRLSTWLYAILLHRYQKSVRRARSRPRSLSWLPFLQARELDRQHENIPSPDPSPSEAVSKDELFTQMRRCVEMLPEKQRIIIWLRFFDDTSLGDMAAVLGCSVGTVKSRLHHALEKLRKMKMNLPTLEGDKQI